MPNLDVTVAIGKMCLLFEESMYTNLIVDHPEAYLFNSARYSIFGLWLYPAGFTAVFEIAIKSLAQGHVRSGLNSAIYQLCDLWQVTPLSGLCSLISKIRQLF